MSEATILENRDIFADGDDDRSASQPDFETDALHENRVGSRWKSRFRKDAVVNSERAPETDLPAKARSLLKRLLDGEDIDTDLQAFLDETLVDGGQAVYDQTLNIIFTWEEKSLELEIQYRLFRTITETMRDYPEVLELCPWRYIVNYFTPILKDGTSVQQEVAKRFLKYFTTELHCVYELQGQKNTVYSLAFTPDGDKLVSGGDTIWIWDPKTERGSPLEGHGKNPLLSLAITPDGQRVVVGYLDNTIRVWDLFLQKQVGPMLIGHREWVHSVTVSPDSRYIVSGATDKTIRVWDYRTHLEAGYSPILGRADTVYSVDVTPDGKYIVAGCKDFTIRKWDLDTGRAVGEPMRGHTQPVYSVKVTPDGKHIISGSGDSTVRLWDFESGTQVGEPLRGHEDFVEEVAVSPDGKYIVSGSVDKTVRVWSVERREAVGEPLRGHTGWVQCVAFAPDGKSFGSGSADGTVRGWSLESVLGW
ncbi:hypothetical protein MD484_g8356, partial [Candolleomyces efflorescens]